MIIDTSYFSKIINFSFCSLQLVNDFPLTLNSIHVAFSGTRHFFIYILFKIILRTAYDTIVIFSKCKNIN